MVLVWKRHYEWNHVNVEFLITSTDTKRQTKQWWIYMFLPKMREPPRRAKRLGKPWVTVSILERKNICRIQASHSNQNTICIHDNWGGNLWGFPEHVFPLKHLSKFIYRWSYTCIFFRILPYLTLTVAIHMTNTGSWEKEVRVILFLCHSA